MVVDEGIMLKVCKKIHKNAFGDIRLMLAIVKDIFERKLMKIKKQARQLLESQDVVEGDLDVPFKDIKINILESVSVVDEKYSDVQGNIISTLSLPNQTCLLAMYFCLQDKKNLVIFVSLVSYYRTHSYQS